MEREIYRKSSFFHVPPTFRGDLDEIGIYLFSLVTEVSPERETRPPPCLFTRAVPFRSGRIVAERFDIVATYVPRSNVLEATLTLDDAWMTSMVDD